MFSKSKKQPDNKKKRDLSQFGLFDISTDIGLENNSDDDGGDSDLEAELAAITSSGSKPRPKPKSKAQIAPSELDKMVAESLRDIGSDEELSGDDDDPDLLNELSNIAGIDASPEEPLLSPQEDAQESPTKESPVVSQPNNEIILPTTTLSTADLIKSRIQMYKEAERNAKTSNDISRARRFGRGLKTLDGLLTQANAGKPINMEDIPPEVAVHPGHNQHTPEPAPTVGSGEVAIPVRQAPSPPAPITPSESNSPPVSTSPDATTTPVLPTVAPVAFNVDEMKITALLSRQKEYKVAALTAKKSGDTASALQYVKMIKVFDQVLAAARAGEPVDLSDMPPPPSQLSLADLVPKTVVPEPTQPTKQEAESQNATEIPQPPEEVPPPPTTILEGLVQRLEKYKSVEKSSKDEGNSSKARRFGRIAKQYEDAIKLHKAGKPVAYDELPTPPGFGPLPMPGGAAPQPAPRPVPAVPVTPPSRPSPSTPEEKPSPPSRPPLQKQDSRVSGNHSNTSVMNKTIETLLERQREYKDAALAAKKAGEIEQAKEYLKIFKGIDNLLNVARGGLPVDLSTLPISPSQREQLEDSFTIVSDNEDSHEGLSDVIDRLEEQLQKQLTMCKTTRDHHKALGDVAGTNRFENLALSVQKDLDIVKFARRKKTAVPKFHYEQKSFNILKCNTDLAETELEINVIRGIGYHVANPKDVDTYVKVEFPYPQEAPYRTKTQLIRDQDSPEYNEKFIAEIQPKARLCQRVFKRYAIKLEVYSKGGFFRSDTLIGTVSLKLQPLETAVEIHDSFDLMDGRKSVGGKLEVKVRIRNPILAKQIENITEKWLIIDA